MRLVAILSVIAIATSAIAEPMAFKGELDLRICPHQMPSKVTLFGELKIVEGEEVLDVLNGQTLRKRILETGKEVFGADVSQEEGRCSLSIRVTKEGQQGTLAFTSACTHESGVTMLCSVRYSGEWVFAGERL